MRGTGAEEPVVAWSPVNAGGAKGFRHHAALAGQLATGGAGERSETVRDLQAGGVEGLSTRQVERWSGRRRCRVDRSLRAGSEGKPLSTLESHGVRDVLPAAGTRGDHPQAGWGRAEAGHSDGSGSDRPDGRETGAGADGGAAVPPRLVRLPTAEVCGRGRRPGTATVLAVRLGCGPRHPCLLRHPRSSPRHAGGTAVHELSVDSPLRRALAQGSRAARGRFADSTALRNPTRGRGKPAAREHLPPSRVRHLDGTNVPAGAVREIRG